MTVTVVLLDSASGQVAAEEQFDLVDGRLHLKSVADRLGAVVPTMRYVDNPAAAIFLENGYSERRFEDGGRVQITCAMEGRPDLLFTKCVIATSNLLWPPRPNRSPA